MIVRNITRLRKLSQILFFLLFLLSLFWVNAHINPNTIGSIFLRSNPMLALIGTLAGRFILTGFLYSLFFLLLTIFLGRVWCGWICPMGALLEWIKPRKRKLRKANAFEVLRQVKYIILIAIIVLAILGSQVLVGLDPITIVYRTVAQSILPAVKSTIYSLEAFLYQFERLWNILDWIHTAFIFPIFGDIESTFQYGLLIFLFFAGILALNWVVDRFWCRYLCPLGGFTGLLSRLAVFRRQVNENCTACNQCARICPTGTIDPDKHYKSDQAECLVCFECTDICQFKANDFKWSVRDWKPAVAQSYHPDRRAALLGIGIALGAATLSAIEPVSKKGAANLIRPPGCNDDFKTLCIRCSACINVCPTQGLQSSGLEGGWPMLLTPRLVPRLGYCDYNCTACADICPTHAIPPLDLKQKQQTSIGLASIDRDRCLPWAYNTPCLICEESCPLPEKAIKLQEEHVIDQNDEAVILSRPHVVRETCIGCGVCEHQCPLSGESAIRVFSPNREIGLPFAF